MSRNFNLDDYNTVAERMAEFFEKYPDGSFQAECAVQQVGERFVAMVKATVYRSPDDKVPGNGHAYEFIPGTTPFTKDSELQNAETAAWGRAILAVGAADAKKGIASREEVRNRQQVRSVPDNEDGRAALRELCETEQLDPTDVAAAFSLRMGNSPKLATNEDLFAFIALVHEGVVTIG